MKHFLKLLLFPFCVSLLMAGCTEVQTTQAPSPSPTAYVEAVGEEEVVQVNRIVYRTKTGECYAK